MGEVGWYWSFSALSDTAGLVWRVDFFGGGLYYGDAADDVGYARCVH
jgi:hypothetical protein